MVAILNYMHVKVDTVIIYSHTCITHAVAAIVSQVILTLRDRITTVDIPILIIINVGVLFPAQLVATTLMLYSWL